MARLSEPLLDVADDMYSVREFMFSKIMRSNRYLEYPHGRAGPRLCDERDWYIITLPYTLKNPLTFLVQYVAMPAGIIRGALARLGFQGTVVPEVTSLPQCMHFCSSKLCCC
jgi:Transport protein particle (TRAPP) component